MHAFFCPECNAHISKPNQQPVDRADRISCFHFQQFVTLQKECRSQQYKINDLMLLPFHCDFKGVVTFTNALPSHSKSNPRNLEFCIRAKDFLMQISLMFKLVIQICFVDQTFKLTLLCQVLHKYICYWQWTCICMRNVISEFVQTIYSKYE